MPSPIPDDNDGIAIALVGSAWHEAAIEGDAIVAHDLAQALLQRGGCRVTLIDERQPRYDVAGIDAVVFLTHTAELRRLVNTAAGCVLVAWMRNWFDAWLRQPDFHAFDIHLASSRIAARYVAATAGVLTEVMPLATDPDRFAAAMRTTKRAADCCFVGSNWGVRRAIVDVAPVVAAVTQLSIYGRGWDAFAETRPCWRGEVLPRDVPALYARHRLVLDDANHVTAPWGSVNTRILDALAAGALPISNGLLGCHDMFDRDFPVFHDAASARDRVVALLADDPRRQQLVNRYRAMVLARHTFAHRADQLLEAILQCRAFGPVVIVRTEPGRAVGRFAARLLPALRRYGLRAMLANGLPDIADGGGALRLDLWSNRAPAGPPGQAAVLLSRRRRAAGQYALLAGYGPESKAGYIDLTPPLQGRRQKWLWRLQPLSVCADADFAARQLAPRLFALAAGEQKIG